MEAGRGKITIEETTSSLHEIKTLILSYHPVIAVETVEEERFSLLLASLSDSLQIPMFEWTVTRGLTRTGAKTSFHGTDSPLVCLKHIGGLTIEGIFLLKDFIPHLQQADVQRQFREVAQKFQNTRSTLILTGAEMELPGPLAHIAVHHRLRLPGSRELQAVVGDVIRSLRGKTSIQIDLNPDELDEFVQALVGMTEKQARQAVAFCIFDDGRLSRQDIPRLVERKAQTIREQGLMEYYPAKRNTYEIGGFSNLKRWLERVRVGFSEKARHLNLTPPRGVLLVGVQGCGKSLAAKYIAREWALPLLRLDAGRLYDKYIGESEKNFRKATRQAESMAPVVLWIDELEKSFPPGGGDADGGVGHRMLGGLLTWMQEKQAGVFLVATANDLSILPPELLRKGRFDEIFFVDLPDAKERAEIFEIHLRLRSQKPENFDLARLAQLSEGFSGAELEQVVVGALYRALHQQTPLREDLLCTEIEQTVPLSVSRKEEIDSLRGWARDRFVPVR